jgi:hypothetical protein
MFVAASRSPTKIAPYACPLFGFRLAIGMNLPLAY